MIIQILGSSGLSWVFPANNNNSHNNNCDIILPPSILCKREFITTTTTFPTYPMYYYIVYLMTLNITCIQNVAHINITLEVKIENVRLLFGYMLSCKILGKSLEATYEWIWFHSLYCLYGN